MVYSWMAFYDYDSSSCKGKGQGGAGKRSDSCPALKGMQGTEDVEGRASVKLHPLIHL